VPPVHTPEVPARAILTCATRPVRDVLIGGAGKTITVVSALAPRLVDYYMEDHLFEDQQAPDAIQPGRPDNLYQPVADDGGARGRYHGHVMKSSMYTTAALHPLAMALGLAAGALAGISFARR
jgi:hypothetical protein